MKINWYDNSKPDSFNDEQMPAIEICDVVNVDVPNRDKYVENLEQQYQRNKTIEERVKTNNNYIKTKLDMFRYSKSKLGFFLVSWNDKLENDPVNDDRILNDYFSGFGGVNVNGKEGEKNYEYSTRILTVMALDQVDAISIVKELYPETKDLLYASNYSDTNGTYTHWRFVTGVSRIFYTGQLTAREYDVYLKIIRNFRKEYEERCISCKDMKKIFGLEYKEDPAFDVKLVQHAKEVGDGDTYEFIRNNFY